MLVHLVSPWSMGQCLNHSTVTHLNTAHENTDKDTQLNSVYAPRNLNPKWKVLAPMPFKCKSTPIAMNRNEIIITNDTDPSWIYTFNINKNQWSKLYEYSNSIKGYKEDELCAFDIDKKELYIWNIAGADRFCLHKINLETYKVKKLTEVSDTSLNIKGAECMIINNTFHVIGGRQSNKHFIYNENGEGDLGRGGFQQIYEFRRFTKFCRHGMVYIESKQVILIFGGVDIGLRGAWTTLDSVLEYNVNTQNLTQLTARIPFELTDFGIVKCRNDRFVVIFGGYCLDIGDTNSIYIYDIDNDKFIESKEVCPTYGKFKAVIYDSYRSSNLLTVGYIREILYVDNAPMDIINIINEMYTVEYVSLSRVGRSNHWSISLDLIFEGLEDLYG